MNRAAMLRGGVTVALSLAAASCSPVVEAPPDFHVRPVDRGAESLSAEDIYYQDAVFAIKRKDYATALDYLQSARTKNPNDARVLNAFGVVYDKLGRFDLSARYYAEAGALDPGSATIANNVAYSRLLQGIMGPQVAASSDAALPDNASPQHHELASIEKPSLHFTTIDIRLPEEAGGAAAAGSATAAPLVAKSTTGNVAAEDSRPTATSLALKPLAVESDALNVHKASPRPDPLARLTGVNLTSNTLGIVTLAAVARIPAAATVVDRTPSSSFAAPKPLMGRPLRIVNASGKAGASDPIQHSLLTLGWSLSKVRSLTAATADVTTVVYPPAKSNIARALARTLPFRVQLQADTCGCNGFQLVVGSDFLKWKATGRHLPSVWRANVASLGVNKGVR